MAPRSKKKPPSPPVAQAAQNISPPSKRRGSAKARLTAARLTAVQALYQGDITGHSVESIIKEYIDHHIGRDLDDVAYVTADETLFSAIVRGVHDRREEIDSLLGANLGEVRKLDRVEPLLRAILRAGLFELMNHGETAAGIVINDYVDVCRAFFDARESTLVNGVLDKLSKILRR